VALSRWRISREQREGKVTRLNGCLSGGENSVNIARARGLHITQCYHTPAGAGVAEQHGCFGAHGSCTPENHFAQGFSRDVASVKMER
jgi:hypothetical protein